MSTKDEALFALDASEVRAGQRWRHLKTGGMYTVIATGLDEATLEPVVIYAGGDGVVWVRSLRIFLEDVDGRPRFILTADERLEHVEHDADAGAETDRFRRTHPVVAGLRELAEVYS